jgi:hypothetical protein
MTAVEFFRIVLERLKDFRIIINGADVFDTADSVVTSLSPSDDLSKLLEELFFRTIDGYISAAIINALKNTDWQIERVDEVCRLISKKPETIEAISSLTIRGEKCFRILKIDGQRYHIHAVWINHRTRFVEPTRLLKALRVELVPEDEVRQG